MTESYSGELVKFVSSLAAATGDLSQLTCPSFLLNGSSLLSYSLHWADHPDLLLDICQSPTPHVAVLRYFISTLYGSYHSRCANNSEKKPFNPVLGEFLVADWQKSNARMVVEQVSHHPPVSAFYFKMPVKNNQNVDSISIQGHCGQKTVFSSGAIKVTQVGRVLITVKNKKGPDTTYTIFPLPELTVAGLLSGKIFIELLGKTTIKSSTGYTTEIEFIPKGWFFGDYFHMKGVVSSSCYDADGAKPLYNISGTWTGKSMLQDCQDSLAEPIVLFDATSAVPEDRKIASLDTIQHNDKALESTSLWKLVSEALQKGDYPVASKLKLEIEEAQRDIRKKRKETQTKFVPNFFQFKVPSGADLEGTTPEDASNNFSASDKPLSGHWIFSATI